MLTRIQTSLAHAFLNNGDHSAEDITALNVALCSLAHSAYLGKTYAHVRLVRHSDVFLQAIEMQRDRPHVLDPLRNHYHQPGWDDEWEGSDRMPQLPKRTLPVLVEETKPAPPHIWARAQRYIQQAVALDPVLDRLVHPSPDHQAQRQNLTITWVKDRDLDAFLAGILTAEYDRTLRTYGVDYHHFNRMWPGDTPWIYGVLHNEHEVAGMCGLSDNPHHRALSYISVAEGFRGHGHSARLYQEIIDTTIQAGKVLVRSSPSDFTLANPRITHAYDRLLMKAPIIHVSTGSLLEKPMIDAAAQHPMSALVHRAKPICDTQLRADRVRLDRWGQAPDNLERAERARALVQPAAIQRLARAHMA